MAKSERKAIKGKPISGHPLFPAVVALWFGALFGLGSLAIRPSLIEGLVLKSGIDLIIPAAAPPLGVTARILIALTMAAAGAVIGGLLARRMTRPKAEVRVRKRSARSVDDTVTESVFRRPISAHDELGASLDAPIDSGNMLAARRRGLTAEEDERPFEPHETAPLPCGEPPAFGGEPAAAAPLDLGAFPAPSVAPEPAERPMAGEMGYAAQAAAQAPDLASPPPGALDWNAAPVATSAFAPSAPFAPPAGFAAPAAAPAAFAPPAHEPPTFALPAYSPPLFAAPADPLVPPFSAPPVAEPAATTPAPAEAAPDAAAEKAAPSIFGLTAVDGQVPSDFVRAAGFKTSVFEVEPVRPLFTDRQPLAQPLPVAAPEVSPAAFAAQQATATPLAAAPSTVAPAPEAAAPTAPSLPRPADLGVTDLARRLQESMARRRAGREAGAPLAASTLAEPVAAAPIVAPQAPAEPAPFAAPQPLAHEAAPAPASEPAFVPPPPFAPFAASDPAQPLAEPAPAIIQPPLAMPAALRPLSFDLPEGEPETSPFDLLPPRHLAMTTPPVAAPPEPFAAPMPSTMAAPNPVPTFEAPEPAASMAATVTAEQEEAEFEEADVAERGAVQPEDAFGSLLSISPAVQRTGFVRIEEPEPVAAAIEPVVIFPGQAPVQPVPVAQVPETPFRRFDSPTAAAQAAPVAATMSAPTVDPGEAEAALRAALANLQRMSGAA